MSIFLTAFFELQGGNLASMLTFCSKSMEYIFGKIEAKNDPVFYRIKDKNVSAIDIAI